MSTLGNAIALAAEEFKGKVDKGGNPYILHCLHVMNTCGSNDENVLIAAVLHDLIEDTDYTYKKLLDAGCSTAVIHLLHLLTHDDKDSYDSYIQIIANSKQATLIKLADLRHNSDITRMKGLRKKDFDRLEKYHKAFMYLSS